MFSDAPNLFTFFVAKKLEPSGSGHAAPRRGTV
jgi:hypothetical protein